MRSPERFQLALEHGAELLRSLGLRIEPPRTDRPRACAPEDAAWLRPTRMLG